MTKYKRKHKLIKWLFYISAVVSVSLAQTPVEASRDPGTVEIGDCVFRGPGPFKEGHAGLLWYTGVWGDNFEEQGSMRIESSGNGVSTRNFDNFSDAGRYLNASWVNAEMFQIEDSGVISGKTKIVNPLSIACELISASFGGMIGMYTSAFIFRSIGLTLPGEGGAFSGMCIGIPIGLSLGSSVGTYSGGKLCSCDGSFGDALKGGILGVLLGTTVWLLTQTCEERAAKVGDACLFFLPSLGAVLSYNLDW